MSNVKKINNFAHDVTAIIITFEYAVEKSHIDDR